MPEAMSQPPLSVVPVFAIPFAVMELPAALQANGVVAPLLAKHAAASPVTAPAADPLCYRSRDDLLEWNDAAVRQVCGEILRGVWSTVAAVIACSLARLAAPATKPRCAFTILQPPGSGPATSHAVTAWCGIYCLE